jgi:PKD repeat protein
MKTTLQITSITLGLIFLLFSCAKPTYSCFTFSPDTVSINTEVTFDASCTKNGGYSYKWDFGDGSPDTTILGNPIVTHKYQSADTYTVRLWAGRKDGVAFREGKELDTKTITVQ